MKKAARFLLAISLASFAWGQQSSSSTSIVPTVIHFSGNLSDLTTKPATNIVGVTFSLYSDQQGGSPLWLETQNVRVDANGHYVVTLGSTTSQGLPSNIFASGEARWLGVQAQGQSEQPRVLLVSVPYALKAGDAETVGGLPPSAFMLATPNGSTTQSAPPPGSSINNPTPPLGGSGTKNFIPLWTDNSGDLGNSILFQSGTTNVGIGTTTPASTLDVNGGVISRGALQLPSIGTATATTGYNSQPFSLQGSSFNSTSGEAIGPLFRWQTEPTGNDSSSPAGTLNLLYGNGSGSPAETGLHIASTGLLTFATGQTFPGTGTITGVKAGTGLSGGGTSGNVTLSINTTFANEYYAQLAAANAFTKSQTITGNLTLNGTGNGIIFPDGTKQTTATTGGGTITGVTAGTDLTGGGTSGNVTLNLDTTKVPQLGAANTFTGLQTISVNGGNEALNVTQQATSGQTYGIIATNYSTGNRSSAILGSSLAGSGIAFGVDGYIVDNDGAGVFGADGNPLSQTGNSLSGTFGSGVWGDGSGIGLGIIGTTDNNTAVAAYNNSSTASAIQGWNENTTNSTTALAPGVFGLSFAPKGIGMVGSGPVHSSTFSSYAGQAAYGVVGDGGPSNIGVLGVADTASAIFGVSTSSGTGVVGSSQNGTGVVGFSSTGFGVSAASTISDGVYGTSTRGTGIYGVSSSASGVYGEGDDKSGSGGAGVYALGENTAVGVFATTSGTASAIVGINDTDAGEFAAPAAMFITDSTSAAGQALVAGGSTQATQCEIDNFGDLYCAGNISSGQVLPDNRVVALYAVQSPENWFEDFGSGSLENGSASIQLEPTFRDTVNTSIDYHVFLTPRGECEGLYVAAMTPTAFEVRELHHGKSSIAFDYRIVAKRNNYEHIRMEDVTKMHEGELAQIQKMVKQSMERPPSIKSISSQSQPQLPASIPAGAAVAATPIGIPVQTKKPAAPIQRHP